MVKAAKNALSFRLLISLRPARNISLFLALCLRLSAFCFKAAMAWYSSFGKVKLSRTILGFLSFVSTTGLAVGIDLGLALALACVTGLALASLAGFETGFEAGFFATTGLALAGALVGVCAFVCAGALLGVGADFLADVLRGAFLAALRTAFLAGVCVAWVDAGACASFAVA